MPFFPIYPIFNLLRAFIKPNSQLHHYLDLFVLKYSVIIDGLVYDYKTIIILNINWIMNKAIKIESIMNKAILALELDEENSKGAPVITLKRESIANTDHRQRWIIESRNEAFFIRNMHSYNVLDV